MKEDKARGYITVYLALTLGIIISLITTMLYGIRIHTIRFETECVMDIGLNSIFAEYHREMLEQYGLLFIDSSYGSSVPSDDYCKSHLLHYMNLNFDKNMNNIFFKNLTAIHADNASIENTTYATDNSGEVLRYQIYKYVESMYGVGLFDNLEADSQSINSLYDEYDNYASMREEATNNVDSIIEDINSKKKEEEPAVSISNPADSVERLSGSNALFYATGNHGTYQSVVINSNDYISKRGYKNGSGLLVNQRSKLGVIEKIALTQYVFEKCGYWKSEKENSLLKYQAEYLIYGCESDVDNLEKMATDIFKIRYVINMMYLLASSEKKSEAELLAAAICTMLFSPELTKQVTYTILFAWGYAESAKDLRILFNGNKLGLVKNDANWNTPLSQLITFRAHLNEYGIQNVGMDYEQYLKCFIWLKNTDTVTMRLMDIMEMDIRKTPGNSKFRADGLIYQLWADVNVSSKYGYGCEIKRFYTYE